MEVVIKTTQVQLDHLIRERKNAMPTVHFLPQINLSAIRLAGDTLTFYSLFHRATGVITQLDDGIEIRIKAGVYWFASLVVLLWASLSFFYCFSSAFVIEEGVTPTIGFRMLVFIIFNIPIWIIYAVIFFKTKQFLNSILKELD